VASRNGPAVCHGGSERLPRNGDQKQPPRPLFYWPLLLLVEEKGGAVIGSLNFCPSRPSDPFSLEKRSVSFPARPSRRGGETSRSLRFH